jgi:hypothetical protein
MLAARIRNLSTLCALLGDAAALPPARSSTEVRHRLTEWTDFHTAVIDLLQALLAKWNGRGPATTQRSAVA